MTKTLRVLWIRLKLSFSEAMHDRADFATELLGDLLVVGVHLVALFLIFRHVPSLNGWSSDQALLVLGFYQTTEALSNLTLHDNLKNFPRMVRFGQLDAALTQPIDLQINLIRRFTFADAGEVLAGLGIIAVALGRLELLGEPTTIPLVVVSLLLSYGFSWSAHFLFSTAGFWLVRNENLVHLAWSVLEVGRLPISAYGRAIDWIGRFIFPIAILGTVPAELLTGTQVPGVLIWSVVVTLALFGGSRWFFFRALRTYSSASS